MNQPYLKMSTDEELHVASIMDPQAQLPTRPLGAGRGKTVASARDLAKKLARAMGIEEIS